MTTTPRPPRMAIALLTRWLPDHDALIGDLVEEFDRRRSRTWLWRQVLAAIITSRRQPRRPVRPLKLAEGSPLPMREDLHVPINLSASPLNSVGGLGIVALGALVAIVRPEAWWFVLVAVVGGIALGIIKVALTRRRFRADPDAFVAQHGMRFR